MFSSWCCPRRGRSEPAVLREYYATSPEGARVLVRWVSDRAAMPAAARGRPDGHVVLVSERPTRPTRPPEPKEEEEGRALNVADYFALLGHPVLEEAKRGAPNVTTVSVGIRRGRVVVKVGVVAQGYIPVGFAEMPKVLTLSDGRQVGVDVCFGD